MLEQRGYDPAGNLTVHIVGGSTRTDYTYDNASRLTGEALDPTARNRRTSYTYDNGDNVTRVERTAGAGERVERTEFAHDAGGRVTRQVVENGDTDLVTTFDVDDRGLVTSQVNPRGNLDGADADAHRVSFRYDTVGQLVETRAPPVTVHRTGVAAINGHRPTTRYGYNTSGEPTHVTDPEGRTTVTGYDRDGRATSVTSPPYTPPAGTTLTPRVTTEYDAAGRPTAVTDPRGDRTTTTYDQLGRAVRITDPPATPGDDPGVTTVEYDLLGELTATTDPTGARTEATYDDLGRQITETAVERRPTPAAYTTRRYYDDAGRLTRLARPAGDATEFVINQEGDVAASIDPLGQRTTYRYDLAGRLQRVIDPLGNATETEYDLAGRPTAVKDLDAAGQVLRTRRTGYNANGDPVSSTAASGHRVDRDFDAAGRMIWLIEPVADGHWIETEFGYDAAGARTRVTDGRGNTVVASYNSLGMVESVSEPVTAAHPNLSDRTWTTSYDAAGNPVVEAEPGGVRRVRTFDALNRMTSETGTGAEAPTTATSYGYDKAGRTTSISAPGGAIAISYDDRGHPIATTAPGNVASSATYDGNGRLTRRTDRAGTATFTWDGDDRLTGGVDPVTGAAYTRTYDNADRLTSIGYGTGGARRTYTYDALDQVVRDEVRSASDAVLTSTAYRYDADGRVLSETVTGAPQAGEHQYSYDRAGRLTEWIKPGGAEVGYGWDDAGNRTKAGSATFSYDERNRLTSGDGSTYTYSPRGTLASTVAGGTTRTSQFDALGRLVTDGEVTYGYDGLGRLARRTVGGESMSFVYSSDGNDQVAVLGGDGSTVARYGRGASGELLGVAENGTSSWAVADRHGDVVASVNPAGTAVTSATAYSPFGEVAGRTGTAGSLGYQGEWTDPSTGQVTMHARWYNPATGVFRSRDSATLEPDPSVQANRYTYGNADPLSYTDPTGHVAILDDIVKPAVRSARRAMPVVRVATRAIPVVNAVSLVGDAWGAGQKLGKAIGKHFRMPSWRDPRADMALTVTYNCFFVVICGDKITAPVRPPGPRPSGKGPGNTNPPPGGGGPGTAAPPPPPPRWWLILLTARTPAPRPPLRSGISQDELDDIVNAGLRSARVATAQNGRDPEDLNPVQLDDERGQAQPSPSSGGAAASKKRKKEESCGYKHYSDLDRLNRPTGAYAVLCKPLTKGTPADSDLYPAGWPTKNEKREGVWEFHRGHLLANRLGGSGDDIRNLMTLYAPVNTPVMRGFEKEVADRIATFVDPGTRLAYKVTPRYVGGEKRAWAVRIQACDEDGYHLSVLITNRWDARSFRFDRSADPARIAPFCK